MVDTPIRYKGERVSICARGLTGRDLFVGSLTAEGDERFDLAILPIDSVKNDSAHVIVSIVCACRAHH